MLFMSPKLVEIMVNAHVSQYPSIWYFEAYDNRYFGDNIFKGICFSKIFKGLKLFHLIFPGAYLTVPL